MANRYTLAIKTPRIKLKRKEKRFSNRYRCGSLFSPNVRFGSCALRVTDTPGFDRILEIVMCVCGVDVRLCGHVLSFVVAGATRLCVPGATMRDEMRSCAARA